ncbi:MAG: ABC transporter substrate-binding protein [Rubricoccaceae bacterium]
MTSFCLRAPLASHGLLALGLLALGLLAGACRAPETPAPPARVMFEDDLGRTVEVPAAPARIVPLAPSLTEMLAAAGGLGRLAAVSPYDSYPPEALALPRVSTYPLDREALLALGADLVVGTDQVNNPAEGDDLARLGVPAVYFRFTSLSDVPRVLRRMGTLLGTEATAEQGARAFEDAVARHAAAARPGAPPRTLVLISDDVLYAFGGASYVHEMVRLAGGESLTARFPGEGVTLSSEFVLEAQPERIVVLGGAGYDPARLVARHPTWRGLPAVAGGHVCGLEADLVSRPGPRLVQGLEALRACLAPAPEAR